MCDNDNSSRNSQPLALLFILGGQIAHSPSSARTHTHSHAHSHALCKYFPSSVSLAGVFRVFARQKNESVWGRIEQRRNIISLKNIFSFYFSLRQKSLSTPRSGVQKEAIEKIYLSFNIRQKFERHSVMSVICVVNKKEVQFTYTLALSANALAHEVDAILFHH